MTQAAMPVSDRWMKVVVGVQVYVLTSYLATAIIPYLWAPRDYPPLWTWILPAWVLGVPGYYITTAGAALAIPLAGLGVVAAVAARRSGRGRLFAWYAGAAVVTALYAVFSLTPPGLHLIGFVAD